MERLEIFDTVSGEVVASGSYVSLVNDGYGVQWNSLKEKWYLRTYHDSIDEELEDFLGTSDYDLRLRDVT